ncbi:ABC transporter permease [Bacillus taeanensis]|uniref:ABC transporter permease n=1 Tax=Bacillus taeanensis TaxID=273032 RepID=A0A366XUH8_9BACI|nr:ABC transporter permease [Bacillus taeanensis]RBW69316.1 ABC transporter permease [Bacillus taeanensis]
MESLQLWHSRRRACWNENLRYMRLIGNSGFMMSLLFAIIFGSYYYSLLVKMIPDFFPVLPLLAVIMTFIVVKSPIRTFLKEADLVFLLPMEVKMKWYFAYSLVYTFTLQSFTVLIVFLVLGPLYGIRMDESSYSYLVLAVFFLLLKAWNLVLHWYELRLAMKRTRMLYSSLRISAAFVFIYLLLTGASLLYLLIVAAIMAGWFIYSYKTILLKYSLKWETLISMDQALVMRFYRIANSFTDVPKLKQKIKPRKWLNMFVNRISLKKQSTYFYLYSKAFIRSGDYFGIYSRLVIIGVFVLSILPTGYGRLIGAFILLYMTALQLYTLWNHFSGQEMFMLYPIEQTVKTQSFQKLLLLLLIIQTITYFLAALVSGSGIFHAMMILLILFATSYIFTYYTLAKKIASSSF